jgi:hypothetical protein
MKLGRRWAEYSWAEAWRCLDWEERWGSRSTAGVQLGRRWRGEGGRKVRGIVGHLPCWWSAPGPWRLARQVVVAVEASSRAASSSCSRCMVIGQVGSGGRGLVWAWY